LGDKTLYVRPLFFYGVLMMKKTIIPYSSTSFLGFSLFLLFPSTDTIQKYLGSEGVAVYIFVGLIALLMCHRLILPKLIFRVTEKQALFLALLTFLCLILIFIVLYPIANSGAVSGGSDADDALNIAAIELLHGRYPYYPKTYLGNTIAPLPGAVLLAVPFVLLGNSAYQNLFWLAVFFLLVRYLLKDGVSALIILWLILVFSPSVMQNVVTGIDHPANTIYILVFIWLMVVFISDPSVSTWKKMASSILLGIGLSSRSNFILLTPLLFSTLVQNAGWKAAIRYIAITLTIVGSVTLPFWLYDPQGFSPFFEQGNKLSQFHSILPLAGIIIPVVSGLIALAFSFQGMDTNCVALFKNCAIVQAFPVLSVIILKSIQTKSLNLDLAGYGLFSLFFGVVALWTHIVDDKIVASH
jgi:hypothetical protein